MQYVNRLLGGGYGWDIRFILDSNRPAHGPQAKAEDQKQALAMGDIYPAGFSFQRILWQWVAKERQNFPHMASSLARLIPR